MGTLAEAERVVRTHQPLRDKLESEVRKNLLYWYARVERASKVLAANERIKRARRAGE